MPDTLPPDRLPSDAPSLPPGEAEQDNRARRREAIAYVLKKYEPALRELAKR